MKLILDYYYKCDAFSGYIYEDWVRHLAQFASLCEEYYTDEDTRTRHFGHSLNHTSQSLHCYQFLNKTQGMSWIEIFIHFTNRDKSENNRTGFGLKLNAFISRQFRNEEYSNDEAFKKLITEIE